MHIKRLKRIHAKEIVNLIKCNLPQEILQTTIYCAEGISGYLELLIESDSKYTGYYYFGYFDEENLIGFVEWRITLNGSIFLNNIFIDSKYQGQGIGKILFRTIFSVPLQNIHTVVLDVNGDNNAKKWYEKIGFKDKAKQFVYTKKIDNLEFNVNCIWEQDIILNYPFLKQNLNVFGFGEVKFSDQDVGIPNKYYINLKNNAISNERLFILKSLGEYKNLICYKNEEIDIKGWKLLTSNYRMECWINKIKLT